MKVIYRIHCKETNQDYVGQTSDFDRRVNDHLANLARGFHPNKPLQNAYNQYGADKFRFEQVEICDDDDGKERETYWTAYYRAADGGFNRTTGGSERYGMDCTWEGVKYRSVKDASKATGINYATLLQRINRGYTRYEDIPVSDRKPHKTSR